MRTLADQMQRYAAYHRDPRNTATHFLGVPLVVFSVFVFLGWVRFAPLTLPISSATFFHAVVFLYYLRLDWRVAAVLFVPSVALLYAADLVAQLPFATSAAAFGASFVGGWIIQLIGHYFEGRRPALVDNLLQIFNAPLFLTVELLFLLGMRNDLKRALRTDLH